LAQHSSSAIVRPRHARDNPLAAIIVTGPIVFDFDSTAATVIALAFGAGAAVLAWARRGRLGSCGLSRRSFAATRASS
jgi:hypothetical protein